MNRRYKILLVEDEVALNMAISIMLMNDYNVETAESAKQARLFFNSSPDLVLSDIRLPDVKGTIFFKELKEYFIDKPIIAMSCLLEQEMINEMAQSGIAIIRKPFTKAEILGLIKKLL